MAVNELLSLLSVIVMALAFWCSTRQVKDSIVFLLQIVGYLLLAASSWFVGVYVAALILSMCAVTLTIKMFRVNAGITKYVILGATLAACLVLNKRGWVPVPAIAAGLGVMYRHFYRYEVHMPTRLFPRAMWDYVRKQSRTLLSKMDNASRLPGHAVDVFMENILGVALWGLYAWLAGDCYMLVWRGVMLAINLINFVRRIAPDVKASLADALPDASGRSKRRIRPGQCRPKRWWI